MNPNFAIEWNKLESGEITGIKVAIVCKGAKECMDSFEIMRNDYGDKGIILNRNWKWNGFCEINLLNNNIISFLNFKLYKQQILGRKFDWIIFNMKYDDIGINEKVDLYMCQTSSTNRLVYKLIEDKGFVFKNNIMIEF